MTTIASLDHQPEPLDGEMQISVVVPIYNEAENIHRLDEEITLVLSRMHKRAEIVYVDDASSDGSWPTLTDLVCDAADVQIPKRVIQLRRNFGQTAALAAGFEAARGTVIIPMDGDLQNDPADIPRLLEKLEAGFDVVSGWRRDRQDRALSRKLPSWVANRIISAVSDVRLNDYGCTLKAYRADLIKDLRLYGDMHRFIPLYLARRGARITECPVNHRPRVAGASKYGPQRIVKVLCDLVLIRFMMKYYARPMHFFGQAALWLVSAAVFAFALMLCFKYGWLSILGIDYQPSFIQTPLPIVVVMLLVGSAGSFGFGILSEILIRVYHEAVDQRPYVVSRVVDSRSYTESMSSAEEI